MTKKLIKIFIFIFFINILAIAPASAFSLGNINPVIESGSPSLGNLDLTSDRSLFSIKSGKSYDQSMDPAFMKSGPADETPQHGYFAVPLLIIGLAGIVLFFAKIKDE